MALDTSLPNAVQQPHEGYFQSGSALSRVLTEAPYLARCSDDKTATRVRPREYAIRYPYMQINRPGMVAWLIFDLDHSNCLAWSDAGLPAPNLIVRNRQNGHSHLYYAIHGVCTSEGGRSHPIQYMKAVYQAFAAALNADPEYNSGPVAKTPGHPWWETQELHSHVHDLAELAREVDLSSSKPWIKGPRLDAASHSRHCLLFERLRYYAYSRVVQAREAGNFEAFSRQLEAHAFNCNQFKSQGFSQDLPLSSLKATVKSVARWTWDHYQGAGSCHRGVMQLDKALPLEERQRQAAIRTHGLRIQEAQSKIRKACRELRAAGQRITYTAIAAQAGLSRQTVSKHRQVLSEPNTTAVTPIAPLQTQSQSRAGGADRGAECNQIAKVKLAVHQVPAALRAGFCADELPDGDASPAVASPSDPDGEWLDTPNSAPPD